MVVLFCGGSNGLCSILLGGVGGGWRLYTHSVHAEEVLQSFKDILNGYYPPNSGRKVDFNDVEKGARVGNSKLVI